MVLPRVLAIALGAAASAAAFQVQAQPAPTPAPPSDKPYPGTITLRVDATDLDHKILRVQQTIPVRPGPLRLYFPRWLPGTHGPNGDVSRLAGLQLSAQGRAVAWTRDPLDTHSFRIDVPAGVTTLNVEFQHLAPVARESGRQSVTREIVNLQWNDVVLYPAGYSVRGITVQPTLVLPAGWAWGSALRAAADTAGADTAGGVRLQPVSLETLVDSPVFAGRYLRRIALDPPGAQRPATLNLVADNAARLQASDAQIEAHRELVRQADRLFGARHYAKYDFLLALSDELGGIGLEHHESSENGVKPDYFDDWDKRIGARELLPHEYTHSWNGKFRRPLDLLTADFSLPMQDSLLWVYEGQTQFWGWVLTARSGLATLAQSRERLAQTATAMENRAGRGWRSLQDTTNDPIAARRTARDWGNWQRSAGDYYEESLLIWLDADTLIREKSGGARSLDDFARAFFGVRDGELGPLTYRFDDVVRTLNGVQPNDWAAFLRERLDSHAAAPTDGLARAGWKLVYTETPSDAVKANEADNKVVDLGYSLGIVIGEADKLVAVNWGSPAFAAGALTGATLVAVNQRAYKPEALKVAITANKDGSVPVELLLRDGDTYRSVRIDYRGGLRYPQLEALPGRDDRLAPLLARR